MTKTIAGAELHGNPTFVLSCEDFLIEEPLVTNYSDELDIDVEIVECNDDVFDLYVINHLE